MPLQKACTLEAFRANVAELIRSGRDPQQAAAVAHETLRDSCKASGQEVPRTDKASDPLSQAEVERFDVSTFSPKVTTTPQGFLKAPANFTRAGIFEYKRFDGKVVRELFPPEEMSDPDSLSTLAGAPVTRDHPREASGPVYINPTNATRFTVGMIGERNDASGDRVSGTVTLMDAGVIADAKAGKLCELSMGYRCLIDPTPGFDPRFGRFDAIQRRRRYNHVALLGAGEGRAGADMALRMDGAAALIAPYPLDTDPGSSVPTTGARRADRKESGNMEEEIVVIGGIEFKVPKAAAQAFTVERKRFDSRTAELEKSNEVLKAQADASKAQADDMSKKLAEATDVKRLDSLVSDRLALVDRARKVWKDAPLTGSSRDIREGVLKKVGVDVAGKSDAYVEARFDALVDGIAAGGSNADATRAAALAAAGGGDGRTDSRDEVAETKARDEMLKRNREGWKQPLSTAR